MASWAVLDQSGKVASVQAVGGTPPVPPGCSVVEIPAIYSGIVIASFNTGKTVEIDDQEIKIDGSVVGRLG